MYPSVFFENTQESEQKTENSSSDRTRKPSYRRAARYRRTVRGHTGLCIEANGERLTQKVFRRL